MLVTTTDFQILGPPRAPGRSMNVTFAPGGRSSYNREINPLGALPPYVTPQVARVVPGGVLIAGCVRDVTFVIPNTVPKKMGRSFLFFTLLDQQTGQLVATFGAGGTTLIELPSACVSSLVLQGDSVLAFGSQIVNGTVHLLKLKVFYNGTVDTTWGGGVMIADTGVVSTDIACAYLVMPDVAASISTCARGALSSAYAVDLWNATTGAAITPTSRYLFAFDPNPSVSGPLNNESIATTCVRHPLGGVVAAGLANGELFAAMRFLFGMTSGPAPIPFASLDSSFGNGGKLVTAIVSTRFGPKFVLPSVLPSGSIILTGERGEFQSFSEQAVRFLSSGQSGFLCVSIWHNFSIFFP
jgi:hypothetical protein